MSLELFDLTGDVAIVTGAGRGIGEGIAKVLAGAGASVVCAARRENEIQRVADEIVAAGGQAVAQPTDITSPDAVDALIARAIAEFGGLDILINNAGGSPISQPLADISEDDWLQAIDLNLTALWRITKLASHRMNDGGRVVNISSRAAAVPVVGSGHYAAAKAGVNSLTETFSKELGPRIRVNGIMPGAVPTEIMMTALDLSEGDLPAVEKMLRLPMRRLGTPEDLGAAALYLSSSASAWVTGQVLSVDGGMSP